MTTKPNTLRGRHTEGGPVVEIIRADGSVFKELPGQFAWGPPDRSGGVEGLAADNTGRINLAKALLGWLMGPNDPRVMQYFQRYKHRVVLTLGKDWTLRADDIKAVVDAIIATEQETSRGRAMVMMTPAPVVSEGGAGVVWDTDPEGRRITRPGE